MNIVIVGAGVAVGWLVIRAMQHPVARPPFVLWPPPVGPGTSPSSPGAPLLDGCLTNTSYVICGDGTAQDACLTDPCAAHGGPAIASIAPAAPPIVVPTGYGHFIDTFPYPGATHMQTFLRSRDGVWHNGSAMVPGDAVSVMDPSLDAVALYYYALSSDGYALPMKLGLPLGEQMERPWETTDGYYASAQAPRASYDPALLQIWI